MQDITTNELESADTFKSLLFGEERVNSVYVLFE